MAHDGDTQAGTVLVVDDAPEIRRLVSEALTGAGFEVLTAADGAEALAIAPATRPDAALVDLVLPDVTGLELIDALLEHRDLVGMPVIAMTGSLTREQLNACLARGAHDYLAKPFGIAELLARVRAAVRIKRVHDDLRRALARIGDLEHVDELTGLASGPAAVARLAEHISAARRHGRPLSALLVDVDDLAALNAQLGRRRGDAALRAIATVLRDGTRAEDVVARGDDDGFLVVLPDVGAEGARTLAERLRDDVGSDPLRVEDVPLEVSVSIGWAAWEAETPETFLDRLRAAAEEARRQGPGQLARG
jgi:diguanylate cyclase (GGDEF)-like protein